MKDLLYKKGVVLILLSIIGFGIYFNSLANGFHFDDIHHIVENKFITDIINIPNFFIDINTFSALEEIRHYRPLLMVTHTINYAVGGLNPLGYHLVNLAFHVGSAYLLFLILNVMLEDREQNNRTAFFASLTAGIIFLVHPFNSEVVNYISARSSVMSGFFYLLAFWCWVNFRQHSAKSIAQRATDTQPSPFTIHHSPFTVQHYYIASIIAFAAGMLTKESVITLPIVLWLYDLYSFSTVSRKQSSVSSTYLPYLPYIIVAVFLYLLIQTLKVGGILPDFSTVVQTQIFTILPVLVKYWYMFIIPVNLTLAHSVEINRTFWSFQFIHSAIILIIVVVIAILLFLISSRQWRVVSFFLVWFFIVMAPVSIIPLNAIFQENRGYVATVSFAVLSGVIVGQLWKTGLRKVTIGVIVLATFLYASGVVQRNTVWKNDITLWNDAVKKSPDVPIAHLSLGSAYRKAGMHNQAIDAYKKAKAVGGPDYPHPRYRLAQVYVTQQRWDLAAGELEEARGIFIKTPGRRNDMEAVYTDLEMVYDKLGKLELVEKLKKEARERLAGGV